MPITSRPWLQLPQDEGIPDQYVKLAYCPLSPRAGGAYEGNRMVTFAPELPGAKKPRGGGTEKCKEKAAHLFPSGAWGRIDQSGPPHLEEALRGKRLPGKVRLQIDAGNQDDSSEGVTGWSARCGAPAVAPPAWCPALLALGFLLDVGAAASLSGRVRGIMGARCKASTCQGQSLASAPLSSLHRSAWHLPGHPAIRAAISLGLGPSAASPAQGC